MIQRMALHTDLNHIQRYFDVSTVEQPFTSKYNISPTHHVPIIYNNMQQQKVISDARWGLFPYWAPQSINTRISNLLHKDYLHQLAQRNRCIIPCTGFYGQKQFDLEKDKRAMHIVKPGQSIFGIAAVYDIVVDSQRNEQKVFTILTDEMTGPYSTWQDIAPVIVHESAFDLWIDRKIRDVSVLAQHLISLDSFNLNAYPVTNQIHKDGFDSPECVKEVNLGFNIVLR